MSSLITRYNYRETKIDLFVMQKIEVPSSRKLEPHILSGGEMKLEPLCDTLGTSTLGRVEGG
jgi:hypothetical protein